MRRFVADFYDQIVHPDAPPRPCSAWASRLSLAAHELVENVFRYGPDGAATFSIIIDPDPAEPDRVHTVRIATRNRAEPHQCEVVRLRLEALNRAEDAFGYYVTLMAESASRAEGSGLGLARVRVEADMQIRCVIEGDELEMIAEARIGSGVGSAPSTVS